MAQLLIESTNEKIEGYADSDDVYKIRGPFTRANNVNRNGRLYPRSIMERAIKKYIDEYLNKNRAIGELNHPDYVLPNIERAAIMIKSLEWKGDSVIGEAVVLNTPQGKQIRALMEAGFNMGVSTRATGSLKENGKYLEVQDDLEFHAVDAVDMPSDQTAYVQRVYESVQWEKHDGVWVKMNEASIPDDVYKACDGKTIKMLENYIENLFTK